jgi:3-hydroxyacyl-CoA dehydrogenase
MKKVEDNKSMMYTCGSKIILVKGVRVMDYRKVVVAGGGVLGSQIAFQTAYCGYDVTIWLRSEESKKRTQPKLDGLKKSYTEAISKMESGEGPWCCGIADEESFNAAECLQKVENAWAGIKLETDIKEALKDADLVIESVAEDQAAKIEFYKMIAPLLEEKTVLVTNSSTFLPSTFAKYTGRPEKYMSLHFANSIWKNNTAEVMVHSQTKEEYFNEVIEFANSIRMIALPILKEKNGYLLNSMLVPFLLSGLDLYVNGVAEPENIDKAWTRGTGAPRGPFQIFDVVGIKTAYNIVLQYQKVPGLLSPLLKKMMMPYNFKGMAEVLKKMIDEGKLGVSSGEGFYKY